MAKPRTVSGRVTREETNITREAQYMIKRAQQRSCRVVTLGPLVFFSTETGDAWILDPSDSLARCLARDGGELPSGIQETPESFAIEWNLAYSIDGDVMTFTDDSGRRRAVLGYPVAEIKRAAQRIAR